MPRLRLGVSACLLGEPVRPEGGHKREAFVAETLARIFELVPVCPEADVLGIPRERIHLEEGRLLGNESRTDHTEAMMSYCTRKVTELSELAGYVLKSRSPSCGLFEIPGAADGRGLFASELVRQRPLLPVEDEARLHDPERAAGFVSRVLGYGRALGVSGSSGQVDSFLSRERLLVLAHGGGEGHSIEDFLAALAETPTRAKHVNALRVAAGALPVVARPGVARAIERFENGDAPLLEPLTLIMRHAVAEPSLAEQTYFTERNPWAIQP